MRKVLSIGGMTHVRTSPYYPQSNGKLERWHGSIKRECIRPAAIDSLDDARRRVARYVERYNHTRLHSAIGYVTPSDRLDGLEQVIFAERDRKLEAGERASPASPSGGEKGCVMTVDAKLQPTMAWAEDRALLRSNPSADPGAKIGAGAATRRPTPSLRDWRQSENPSQQDAATLQAGCPLRSVNPSRPRSQFTVNQDRARVGMEVLIQRGKLMRGPTLCFGFHRSLFQPTEALWGRLLFGDNKRWQV